MNIYETLASGLILEHGRGTFMGAHYGYPLRLGTEFWRALLLAYGHGLYRLPEQYRTPLPPEQTQHNFSVYNVETALALGLDPVEVFTLPTATRYTHKYTPIHVATALLRYGDSSDRSTALKLLQPEFLTAVFPKQEAATFCTHSHKNPYPPEAFDLEALPYEAFAKDGNVHVVDEIGNAAWLSSAHLDHILRLVSPEMWFSRVVGLSLMHPGRWEHHVQRGAYRLLSAPVRGNAGYGDRAKYLYYATPSQSRAYLRTQDGSAKLLWTTLSDATPEEMARGLKVMATSYSAPIEESFAFLGRELTIEDLRLLTPLQVLRILGQAPFETVRAVISAHSGELGGILFALTTKEQMMAVTNCMSPHAGRRTWRPGRLIVSEDPQEAKAQWDTWAQELVRQHLTARDWRNDLLEVAEPAVAFLAAIRRSDVKEIPVVAIDNALRSHPNINAIQEVMARIPAHLAKGWGK